MRRTAFILTFSTAALLVFTLGAEAKDKKRNGSRDRDSFSRNDRDTRYYDAYDYGYRRSPVNVNINLRFDSRDQRYLRDWVRVQNVRGLPPGLAYRDLPPGLQKQLRRNGSLPPGLQRRITPVPVVVVQQLRPLPRGYDYVFLDRRAFIVGRATGAILDVISLF